MKKNAIRLQGKRAASAIRFIFKTAPGSHQVPSGFLENDRLEVAG